MRFRELGDAMGARATTLLAGGQAGRRDTAYMLICAARAVDPPEQSPISVHRRVEHGETPLTAYRPKYLRMVQDARYYVIRQAMDAVGLRPGSEPPGTNARIDMLTELALRDEEGLYDALARLEALRPG